MENMFNKDFVTIVRKKGDSYVQEEINTRKMLPNSNASDKKIRESVIARLRKDPSVLVVLEDKGGHCDEHFEHKDFDFAITLIEGERDIIQSFDLVVLALVIYFRKMRDFNLFHVLVYTPLGEG